MLSRDSAGPHGLSPGPWGLTASPSHFRNHRETRLDGTARFNLLVGENGAGKNQRAGGAVAARAGPGLRRAALPDMPAQHGDGGFGAVSAELVGEVRLGTGVRPERPGRRIVQVNGAEAPALRLAEWLSIGWLTPAMDRPVRGRCGRAAAFSRPAGAGAGTCPRPQRRAGRALRERNRLLAGDTEPDPAWLDALEVQLAEAGALVAAARARLVERLSAQLALLPEAPFARPELVYRPGGPLGADELAAAPSAESPPRPGGPAHPDRGRTATSWTWSWRARARPQPIARPASRRPC